MAITLTYFVHGTSVDNEANASSGWQDAPLSELGLKQARELRELTAGKTFDVVFCSDLKRASDTAELAFSGRTPIIADARLRECSYGVYNGGLSEVVEPLQEKYVHERFPDGESYEGVKERIADFLKFLKEKYDGKRVAVVAHKAPQLALDVLVKGKSWKEAFAEDWRKTRAWQPGWEYTIE